MALLVFAALSLAALGRADEGGADALAADFVAAGEAYRAGRYEEALGRYEGLVVAGWRNGALFYNLGNSYFQTGQLGEAVRAYRRAERYLPRDADLRHNQAIAEGTVEDVFARSGFGYALASLAFWYDRATLRELEWGAVAMWLLTVAASGVAFFRPRTATRVAVWVSAGLLVALGASAGAKAWVLTRTDPAIVIVESAVVRAGPSFREAVTAKLPEGNAVEILETEGAYSRVDLPDGRQGWVESEALGRVRL